MLGRFNNYRAITFLALAPKFLGVERCSTVDHLSGLCGTRNVFFGCPSVSLMNSYTLQLYINIYDCSRQESHDTRNHEHQFAVAHMQVYSDQPRARAVSQGQRHKTYETSNDLARADVGSGAPGGGGGAGARRCFLIKSSVPAASSTVKKNISMCPICTRTTSLLLYFHDSAV